MTFRSHRGGVASAFVLAALAVVIVIVGDRVVFLAFKRLMAILVLIAPYVGPITFPFVIEPILTH